MSEPASESGSRRKLVGRIDYEAERHEGSTAKLSVKPSEALALLYTDCVCVWPPALRSALEFFGPERVMYGSDYPFWDPALSFEAVAGTGLDTAVLERICHANAASVMVRADRSAAAMAQRENPPR